MTEKAEETSCEKATFAGGVLMVHGEAYCRAARRVDGDVRVHRRAQTTFFPTARPRPACATASTQPPCASYRRKTWKRKATVSI